VDLVDPNIKITTTLSSRGLFDLPFFTFPHPRKGGSFAQVKVVGTLTELNFITRNNEVRLISLFLSTPVLTTLTLTGPEG
jgi:hypothetical protein